MAGLQTSKVACLEEMVHLVLDSHKDSHVVNYDLGVRVHEKFRLPLRDKALRNTANGDEPTVRHVSCVKRHRHFGAIAPARIVFLRVDYV